MDPKINLRTILDLHGKWRRNEPGGVLASLRGANLIGANLIGADLRSANLSSANLIGANLSSADLSSADLSSADLIGANLIGADLRSANLSGADLRSANLSGANLIGANLRSANLIGADLIGADLRSANLIGADLSSANLRDADLSSANLSGADLSGANLSGANLIGATGTDLALAMSTHLPGGPIWGWKKCRGGVIVKLLIPAEAKRSHGCERKCRAEFADVLEVIGAETGESDYGNAPSITYRAGERVTPNGWDEDRWNTCGQGIHFFITRLEAENYCL